MRFVLGFDRVLLFCQGVAKTSQPISVNVLWAVSYTISYLCWFKELSSYVKSLIAWRWSPGWKPRLFKFFYGCSRPVFFNRVPSGPSWVNCKFSWVHKALGMNWEWLKLCRWGPSFSLGVNWDQRNSCNSDRIGPTWDQMSPIWYQNGFSLRPNESKLDLNESSLGPK